MPPFKAVKDDDAQKLDTMLVKAGLHPDRLSLKSARFKKMPKAKVEEYTPTPTHEYEGKGTGGTIDQKEIKLTDPEFAEDLAKQIALDQSCAKKDSLLNRYVMDTWSSHQ